MTTIVLDLTSVESHLTSLMQAYDLTLAAIVECSCGISPVLCGSCLQREMALDTFATEWERIASYVPAETVGRSVLACRPQVISWEE